MHECPSRAVGASAARVLHLWGMWEAGSLPVAGGVLDQAAGVCDAMRLISAEVNRHRETERAS